tara:strand:- start:143 stop:1060 length:918 start_codon:yes stop_codon:yes gene_type:complete
MSYIGRPLQVANLAVMSGVGDGSDTTPIATLDYATTTNGIAVYLDGVRQLPSVDYNVTNQTTLTFTTAPANLVGIDVYFLGLELSIPTPADATVAKAKITTTLIHEHVDTTITAADSILFSDSTGSNANKKDTVQGILDLVPAAGITQGTVAATTSGTAVTFTSIPSGTKRIKVILSGVSIDDGGQILVRVGDSGGIHATGYLGSSISVSVSTAASDAITTGFECLEVTFGDTNNVLSGIMDLCLIDASTNTWIANGSFGNDSSTVQGTNVTGSVSLDSALDRVSLTSGGTPSDFDAGKVNIQYE